MDFFSKELGTQYRVVITGSLLSLLATGSFSVALALEVISLTGSSVDLGTTLLFGILPYVLFGPAAGIVCDRINRKNVILASNAVKSFISFSFVFALKFSDVQSLIYILYFISFSLATLEVFSFTAFNSVIPQITPREKVLHVNSVKNSLSSSIAIFSPLFAVFIHSYGGLFAVACIMTLCYFLAFFVNRELKVESLRNKSEKNLISLVKNQCIDGVRIFTRNTQIASLSINGFATHLFLTPFLMTGIPYIIVKVHYGSPFEYGVIEGVAAFGMMLSIFVVPKFKKLGVSNNLLLGMAGMFLGTALLLFYIHPEVNKFLTSSSFFRVGFFSVACFITFLSFGLYGAHFSSFLHNNISPDQLGKGMAFQVMLISIGRSVGVVTYGYLLEYSIPLTLAVLVSGMFTKFLIHIPFVSKE